MEKIFINILTFFFQKKKIIMKDKDMAEAQVQMNSKEEIKRKEKQKQRIKENGEN